MSTLRVNTLQNTSTTDGGISIDTSGHVTVDNVAMPSAGPLSNRNKIINGDMRIDQRNAGASVTPSNDGAYTVDRWFIRNYGGTGRFSVQQDSASPNDADPSVKLTVTTTDTPGTSGYSFGQSIEGFNFSSLAYGTASAQTATVSFWVRSSVTGTYCLSVRNSVTNRSYVAEYSISAANTWEYKTITFAGDTAGTWLSTNGTGATLEWSLGSQTAKETTAGSWQAGNYVGTSNQTDWISTNGATFYITGVQLEVGSVATPFEHRSYGDELQRCQRYYIVYASETNDSVATAAVYQSGRAFGVVNLPVQMRNPPTIVSTSGSNYYNIYSNGSFQGFNTFVLQEDSVNAVTVETSPSNALSLTAGHSGWLRVNNASGSLAFNAEL